MKTPALNRPLERFRQLLFFFPPPRVRWFARELRGRRFSCLDLGCANRSASLMKNWFPHCEYHGVDRLPREAVDAEELQHMDHYYAIDLTRETLSSVPDAYFDVLIMNHVLEHLPNGDAVLRQALLKVRPGGRVYVEYPSVRSLSLPSMRGRDTLHFCDDPTHVRLYDLKEIGNILLSGGFRIVRGGIRRELWRLLLLPMLIVFSCLRGNPASPFWTLFGFAEFVYAVKDPPNGAPSNG